VSRLAGAEAFRFDGGPVGALLCHGYTGTPQSLRPWGEHLAAGGLTVSCPLQPGHGTRWQDLNRTRWPDWYDSIEAAYDELADRCAAVFVMGLSAGGALALRLAQCRPDAVAGLVLVNPSLMTTRRSFIALPVLQWVVPSLSGPANDIRKVGVVELAYDRAPLRALYSLTRLWRVVRADLPLVTAPLLVFRSARDHVVEPVNTALLLATVGSTVVEERVLANSYHVATLDHDAPTVFHGSLDFVRAHAPAAAPG
jgi:carboxylesterase